MDPDECANKRPSSSSSNVSTPSLILPNTDSFVLLQEYAANLLHCDSFQIESVPCSTPVKDLLAIPPAPLAQKTDSRHSDYSEEESATLRYSTDDSVKDPTFNVGLYETSQIQSDESINSPPRKLHKSNKTLPTADTYHEQHCEFNNCTSEVFSTCHICLCLLCYEHFIHIKDCKNHTTAYLAPKPTSTRKRPIICQSSEQLNKANNSQKCIETIDKTLNTDKASGNFQHCEYENCRDNSQKCIETIDKSLNTDKASGNFQHCEYENCTEVVFGSCEKCSSLLCFDHFNENAGTICEFHQPFSSENQDIIKEMRFKKSEAKILRNKGKAYCNSKQKIVQPRQLKPPCNESCKLKCSSKFPDSIRQQIFNKYWAMGDLNRQRDYIQKHIQDINPKYRYEKSDCCRQRNRTLNKAYYLTLNTEKIRVCKHFFKATLDVTDRAIRTVIQKADDHGVVADDARGMHSKHSKKTEERAEVHAFIDKIPRIESHYLRAQTTKEFIDGGLTLTQMYNDYKESCIKSEKRFVSKTVFSQIFHADFNISFFIPKKDQCETCASYKNSSEEEKKAKKDEHDKHLKEKDLSRKEKECDKNKVSPNYVVACYDLQAVLPSPRGDISLFYYISKVATYNFTISELKTSETFCYVWHEGQGNRGVTEIGSCVYKYLEAKCNSYEKDDLEIVFFSDNCCGQQKNKMMIALYVYAVHKFKIKSITHKFLIKGHTQSEGDSVHSVIEKQIKKALKSGPIYVPDEYVSLIKTAKKNPPYFKVEQLCFEDFYAIKKMAEEIGSNFSKTDDNASIKLADIKVIKIYKDDPYSFLVKTSYEQCDYMRVNIRRSRRQYSTPTDLQKAYSEKMVVCEKKKNAILKLIEGNHIPKVHFDFYNNL